MNPTSPTATRSSSARCLLAAWIALAASASATAAQVGTVARERKISATTGGFGGVLDDQDRFGLSLASLGDLDGDGVGDLAVGAADDDGGTERGAVWILFLDAAGAVATHQKISSTAGGFAGPLDDGDRFGSSIAALGDLDGNGVVDLAVGAPEDDDVAGFQGAVWILFLEADGTVAAERKIGEGLSGFGGALEEGDLFGVSLAALGDLDGNGVADLAVGAPGDADGGAAQGAVWILFLEADGSVAAEQEIDALHGGFGGDLDPIDFFGASVAAPGDLDGDGATELAVGAWRDDDGGFDQGAVWILFLNADGTVAAQRKISETRGGFGGDLDPTDLFGSSLAAVGDLDGNGVRDLAIGAIGDDDGINMEGALWIAFLNADGRVAAEQKISATRGGFGGDLDFGDSFGSSVAALDAGDDGSPRLAVGAFGDDDGGLERGAAWVLSLWRPGCVRLDFETEDDLVTPLVNGQHLDTEFGDVVALSSSGPNAGLAIFDSTRFGANDPSQDPDLLVGTGNLLILQTENFPPDANDVFPRPNDDEDGGTIALDFERALEPVGLRLVDVDAGDGGAEVVLLDAAGRKRTYAVPSLWTGDRTLGQPGHAVLDLATLAPQPGFGSSATASQDAGFDPRDVVRVEVRLDGSGAVDDFRGCSPAPRASVAVRAGALGNPTTLSSSSLPVLGTLWSASLDCAGHASGLATLWVRARPSVGAWTPLGEVLIGGTLLARVTLPFAGAPVTASWALPGDAALLGRALHVQGLCRGVSQPAPGLLLRSGRLSNALDLVLGR